MGDVMKSESAKVKNFCAITASMIKIGMALFLII
jgi:hypothetical protein